MSNCAGIKRRMCGNNDNCFAMSGFCQQFQLNKDWDTTSVLSSSTLITISFSTNNREVAKSTQPVEPDRGSDSGALMN